MNSANNASLFWNFFRRKSKFFSGRKLVFATLWFTVFRTHLSAFPFRTELRADALLYLFPKFSNFIQNFFADFLCRCSKKRRTLDRISAAIERGLRPNGFSVKVQPLYTWCFRSIAIKRNAYATFFVSDVWPLGVSVLAVNALDRSDLEVISLALGQLLHSISSLTARRSNPYFLTLQEAALDQLL